MYDITAVCHRFIGRQVVIAQGFSPSNSLIERYQRRRAELQGTEHLITRDDLKQIHAVHFLGNNCTADSPTLIFFNGNGAHFQSAIGGNGFEVAKWLQEGVNVVCFNYHGVDIRDPENRGTATRDGLIRDGRAVIHHVKNHFGVPEEHITLYGYSLGAGPSSHMAIEFPKTKICFDRTFTKLSQVVQTQFGSGIIGKILAALLRFFDWEFDVEANCQNIATKRKWVIDSAQDEVILPQARLSTVFTKENEKKRIISLLPTRDQHHCRPLDNAALKACTAFMRTQAPSAPNF